MLGFLDQLASLGAGDEVDLMVLNHAGPVARERALVGARVLFESRPGEFATTQIAAIMERMDTDWLRALDLELNGTVSPRDLDAGIVQARLTRVVRLQAEATARRRSDNCRGSGDQAGRADARSVCAKSSPLKSNGSPRTDASA